MGNSISGYFLRDTSPIDIPWTLYGPVSPGLKIQLFLLFFFFFQIKKNAVNWTVKPGQKRLNLARIGYIDIKRYFRAIYLHK
jgi:hypothetical protein